MSQVMATSMQMDNNFANVIQNALEQEGFVIEFGGG